MNQPNQQIKPDRAKKCKEFRPWIASQSHPHPVNGYDITIDTDQDGLTHISWREPHIIVRDDRREIEYWEAGTVSMITH